MEECCADVNDDLRCYQGGDEGEDQGEDQGGDACEVVDPECCEEFNDAFCCEPLFPDECEG